MEYVTRKLNESVTEKMSKLEDFHEPHVSNDTTKQNPSSLKRKTSKKRCKNGGKMETKKQNPRGTNLIEKRREIHEAYQVVLNEYHRRLGLRRKSLELTNAFRRRSVQHEVLKSHHDSSASTLDGRYIFFCHF